MATIWRRLFKRKDYASELAEKTIEEQRKYEARLPAGYAPDQRKVALLQRARKRHGGDPPEEAIRIMNAAAEDWARASRAAEDVK